MITTITKAALSALALAAVAAGAAAPAFAQSSSEVPLARAAAAVSSDPFAQFLQSVAQAGNTGSAIPLPPCTPGTVTQLGCEPHAAHATAASSPVMQSPAGVEIGWFPTFSRCQQAASDYDNARCYPVDGGWALILG